MERSGPRNEAREDVVEARSAAPDGADLPHKRTEKKTGAPEHREQGDQSAAYTTVAIGAALLVAAVLIIATTGVPASGLGFIIGAAACLGWGVPQLTKQRRALPGSAPHDKERELLSAIRDNGGDITPAEAAMETSLTVREADALLSELANGGHLMVGSEGGALRYALPVRRAAALGDR